MKLYLLNRTDYGGWDIYLGFVIAADSAEEALAIARKEGGSDWVNNDSFVDIKEIGEAGSDIEKGVSLDSYCAG